MLYVDDRNPKIFTEFNKENKMYVFSGEIFKGIEISLWMEKCKQMEKLLCKCMIHSFPKEIIWPEKYKTGIWPQQMHAKGLILIYFVGMFFTTAQRILLFRGL